MTAIESIRRDLRDKSWLEHSRVPFAGMVHDFTKPLRARLEQRQYTSPYYWSPGTPGKGRGFYQSSKGLYVDRVGSTFDLRLEWANDYIATRLNQITGYYTDPDGDGETLKPIIARLPHNRGFLAGWTMGKGMCAALDSEIYATPQAAAFAAHDKAENDAETQREFEAAERERLEQEESEKE